MIIERLVGIASTARKFAPFHSILRHAMPLTTTTTTNNDRNPNNEESSLLAKPVSVTEAPSKKGTDYPKAFANAVAGRQKAKLGDLFGIQNFGVNYTTLEPGSSSALMHHHKVQDEFVYVVEGEATLCRMVMELQQEDRANGSSSSKDSPNLVEKTILQSGDCIGFPAGVAIAHCITNESNKIVRYLEVGDRTPNDLVEYATADLRAIEEDGQWRFTHKDGKPYDTTT